MTAVTALGLGLVAPVSSSVTTAAADPSDCPSGPASARMMEGGDHGADPNSVSAAQAAAMDRALDARIRRLEARGQLDRTATRWNRKVHVPTYVHVITRADGTGGVTWKQVRDQMKVLNAGFAGFTARGAARTPFRFVLKGISRTANDTWYEWPLTEDFEETPEVVEAKTALHRGGWASLNVYVAGLGSGLLGYATFPQDATLATDGVVLLNESLPGGTAAPYNEGDTGTHEVGHWLGLFHTFENGCTVPGDHVADTPYQLDGDNIFFCEESDDTCKQPGKDPVHNFMSYGDDPCLDTFSRGQSRRMSWTWYAYRAFR